MKRILSAFLLFVVCLSGYQAIAETKTNPAIQIKWLGGPTMLVTFNGFQFMTDPMLGSGDKAFLMGDPNEMFDLRTGPKTVHHKRYSPVPDVKLKDVDLFIFSHAHEDHFDQTAEQRINKEAALLVPPADLQKIEEKGFKSLTGLNWGESISYKAGNGRVTFTAIIAHHSANPQIDPILGTGNGYWIEFKEGTWEKTIYWTGDTLPTKDVLADVRTMGELDVLIPHMGRVGTSGPLGLISMGSDEVQKMSEELSPKNILPIHHSTYSLYLEPISIFVKQGQDQPYDLDLLTVGSTVTYR